MRFLVCKLFTCFCKSSSQIYSPAPLKLENSHHVPTSTAAVVSPSVTDYSDQFFEVKDDDDEQKQQPQTDSDDFVKSCLKKKTQLKETTKKKVRWMDYYSRERKALVEIREFEPSEYEVRNNQGNGSRHGCIIL